jgi:hypothetical protein
MNIQDAYSYGASSDSYLMIIIAISVYAFYMQFYCHQITSRYQRYPLTISV